MLPILVRFSVAGHEYVLGSYSTFMALAWIAMVAIGTWGAAHRGIAWRRALAVFAGSLLAGVAGARLFDVLGAAGQLPAESVAAASFTGFALYGGLVAGSFAAIALARALRLRVWELADCAVPALAVGIALMRVGCFLRGCCFGEPTALPWGVTFPTGSPAWAQQLLSGTSGVLGMAGGMRPVHPTQLYELAAALALAAVALTWRRYRRPPVGATFLAFAIGFTLFRFANGFLRAPAPGSVPPAWLYPSLYAAIVVAATALLVHRFAENPSTHAITRGAKPDRASAPTGPPPLPWEAGARG